jgi:hypothetical protein
MSREAFDVLIYLVIGVGLLFAARRLYQDLTRPLPRGKDEQDHPSKQDKQERG